MRNQMDSFVLSELTSRLVMEEAYTVAKVGCLATLERVCVSLGNEVVRLVLSIFLSLIKTFVSQHVEICGAPP